MRLQRSVSRRTGRKDYIKHQIVIPNDTVSRLGWNHEDTIGVKITSRGLLLFRSQQKEQDKEPNYDAFEESVTKVLSECPAGCTWQQIRFKANLQQKTPSPIWVKRLQDHLGLRRQKDPNTGLVTWTIPRLSASKSTLNGWVLS